MDSQRTNDNPTPTNLSANIQKNKIVEHIYTTNLPYFEKKMYFCTVIFAESIELRMMTDILLERWISASSAAVKNFANSITSRTVKQWFVPHLCSYHSYDAFGIAQRGCSIAYSRLVGNAKAFWLRDKWWFCLPRFFYMFRELVFFIGNRELADIVNAITRMLQTFSIGNRRYLGNKFKLLQWIRKVVDENCADVTSLFDVFSGTGSVSSAFIDKRLLICDMMKSNYLAALCWFSPDIINRGKLAQLLEYYNFHDTPREENYFSEKFSN